MDLPSLDLMDEAPRAAYKRQLAGAASRLLGCRGVRPVVPCAQREGHVERQLALLSGSLAVGGTELLPPPP
jgi:hypothetical protein